MRGSSTSLCSAQNDKVRSPIKNTATMQKLLVATKNRFILALYLIEKLENPLLARILTLAFNLLMGVELPVSVSFGHVQLPLRDVLKLTAGSIIELNRTVDEPVEVIVNNCVVARRLAERGL